jgi:hypothetical protein
MLCKIIPENPLFSKFVHSGFPIKFLYAFLFSLIRATCPAHLEIYLEKIKIGWCRLVSSGSGEVSVENA